jgi:hypothetical protein
MVERIVRSSGMVNVQFKADVVRLLLLEQYGGMWMDANSFLLYPLSWIDTFPLRNPQPNPQIILGAYTQRYPIVVDGVDLGSLTKNGTVQKPYY